MNGELLREETAYGMTRMSPEKADAARLLKLNRGHWCIENRLHWVRDVTFDEDRSQMLLFLHWEEQCSYVQELEQQWAYKLGLKDGAQLLFGLLQSGEPRQEGHFG